METGTVNTANSRLVEPWISPRVVVQGSDGVSAAQTGLSDTGTQYDALKKRLTAVPIRSRHRCQRLYCDRFTNQYWLGITSSMSSRVDRREILKPLPLDVAYSLCKIAVFPQNGAERRGLELSLSA